MKSCSYTNEVHFKVSFCSHADSIIREGFSNVMALFLFDIIAILLRFSKLQTDPPERTHDLMKHTIATALL